MRFCRAVCASKHHLVAHRSASPSEPAIPLSSRPHADHVRQGRRASLMKRSIPDRRAISATVSSVRRESSDSR